MSASTRNDFNEEDKKVIQKLYENIMTQKLHKDSKIYEVLKNS